MRSDLVAGVAPVVEATGYIFWGLEFRPYGRGKDLLRVYIDHENGIGVDDCEKVSRELSRVLDVENSIRGEYILEVSSPGLNRRLFLLDQFHHFCGETIALKTKRLLEGRKNFNGILKNVVGDIIHVKENETIYAIPFDEILNAHIVKI